MLKRFQRFFGIYQENLGIYTVVLFSLPGLSPGRSCSVLGEQVTELGTAMSYFFESEK